jgi:hypothetical protein
MATVGTASSYPEAKLEGSQTFKEAYGDAIKAGKTAEEASAIGEAAAKSTELGNMGLLAGTNTLENLLTFSKIPGGRTALKAFARLAGTMGTNALEEAGQSAITNLSQGKDIDMNDVKQSAALGAIAGGGFHLAGKGLERLSPENRITSDVVADAVKEATTTNPMDIYKQSNPEVANFLDNNFTYGGLKIPAKKLLDQFTELDKAGQLSPEQSATVSKLESAISNWKTGGREEAYQIIGDNLDKFPQGITVGNKQIQVPGINTEESVVTPNNDIILQSQGQVQDPNVIQQESEVHPVIAEAQSVGLPVTPKLMEAINTGNPDVIAKIQKAVDIKKQQTQQAQQQAIQQAAQAPIEQTPQDKILSQAHQAAEAGDYKTA